MIPCKLARTAALALVLLAVRPAGAAVSPLDARPAAPPVQAALILEDDDPGTRRSALAAARAEGVVVAHLLDGLLIVEGTHDALLRLASSPGVRDVAERALGAPRRNGRNDGLRRAVAAWNARVELRRREERARGGEAEAPAWEQGHALVPPSIPPAAVREALRAAVNARVRGAELRSVAEAQASTDGGPYGATESNTSEFLAGSVSLNVFLVQCDGSIDSVSESWSADREAQVVAEILEGLDWVRAQEPQSGLTFVHHVFPGRTDARARTGYEPIRRPADPMGATGENLWLPQILGNLGFTTGDRFARSRALAHQTRSTDGTDWGVNVFVVDSWNDTDGMFADGRFAYAWISGPHLVMTFDNQNWGVSRMNMVLRHEILHGFYAFDEYSSSACGCAESRGYLDGRNTNCNACNPAAASCVMVSNGTAMCSGTRRQIGWADLDGDGTVDVVGEDPDTFLDALPAPICGPLALRGLSAVVAATNRNPVAYTPRVSISVNRIAGVEYRVDGGAWAPADPADGAWGDATERYAATLDVPPGLHSVETRARDDHGNVDASPRAAQADVRPAAAAVGSSLVGARAAAGAAFSWAAAGGAALYRLERAVSPGGSWVAVAETSTTTAADTYAGTAYYRVRSVDACGGESAP